MFSYERHILLGVKIKLILFNSSGLNFDEIINEAVLPCTCEQN